MFSTIVGFLSDLISVVNVVMKMVRDKSARDIGRELKSGEAAKEVLDELRKARNARRRASDDPDYRRMLRDKYRDK